jgi:hypothetical protein
MAVETRFLARVQKFYVQGGFVRLLLDLDPSQLGRVIHLAAFTGGGVDNPRPFAVRIVAKEIPGLAWRGMLKRLTINQIGGSSVDMLMDKGFDLGILARMTDRDVAIEAKEVDDSGQPA